MPRFTAKDIRDYYDQTEAHFRRFWKMDRAMGLHYGIWNDDTRSISEAILNTNHTLMRWGNIDSEHHVLDAGCGVGGSSIYLAKHLGCQVKGITLSKKQVSRARAYAKKHSVDHLVTFSVRNYLQTGFPDNHFDVVWALESFSSCQDNEQFFKEMSRILKPEGKLLLVDFFKPFYFDIEKEPHLKVMMNGWAISDILSLDNIRKIPMHHHFDTVQIKDCTAQVARTVQYMYRAGLLGMVGTKLYNLFKKATPFSRTHYKTGIAQKKAYDRGSWGYYMVKMTVTK